MAYTIFPLQQNVYKSPHYPIFVENIHENFLSAPVLWRFVLSTRDATVGVASVYRSDCSLSCLAFATLTRVLVVHFTAPLKTNQQRMNGQEQQLPIYLGRALLRDFILCNPNVELYGYRIDRIAVALFLDLSLRINAAVDILSMNPDRYDRRSPQSLMNALGGDLLLHTDNVKALFAWRGGDNPLPPSDVALQAWVACRAATLPHIAPRYATISRIATNTMSYFYLSLLAKIARDAEILESRKPTKVINNVKADFGFGKGSINLECTRFNTRIMSGKLSDQIIHIETQVGEKRSTITGKVGRIDGRQAHINVKGAIHPSGKILSVTTIGKEAPTSAEAWREDVVRKVLQGTINLTDHPFFCSIWMPSSPITWPPPPQGRRTNLDQLIYFPGGTLNASQDVAVQKIVSEVDEDRVVLIQGPPGTGKTTVIAASVSSIVEYGNEERTIWLVAQSNVAVKNIAEKLDKVGFREFKLLVSRDFHYDWHEHLYERLEHCFIRSDMLGGGPVGISRLLLDARVILCTLSMLSNPYIDEISRQVPLHTIIFDEASQIEVGDYLPLLHRFRSHLQKMVFIGDDRQLAPFGQDDVQQLRSVFEFPHLRRKAYFLDTQYRMPVVIGEFISRHVYDRMLKTDDHNINTKSACRFLDVKTGQEKKSGCSWVNENEAAIIIHLARLYVEQGKQYRVITPYDAQRTLIEKQLQLAKLPWEDKCFNVDSFQGNEEDYIIVSLVRSHGIGFLKNMRRTNVMLTRCKKSMIICTSRRFVMGGEAAGTLVGKLAAAMGPEGWLDSRDILRGVLP